MQKENRTSMIKVMLTADEKAAIIAAAHRSAQDASPWLRGLAIQALRGDAASHRAHAMNAELPAETLAMLKLKGMA